MSFDWNGCRLGFSNLYGSLEVVIARSSGFEDKIKFIQRTRLYASKEEKTAVQTWIDTETKKIFSKYPEARVGGIPFIVSLLREHFTSAIEDRSATPPAYTFPNDPTE